MVKLLSNYKRVKFINTIGRYVFSCRDESGSVKRVFWTGNKNFEANIEGWAIGSRS